MRRMQAAAEPAGPTETHLCRTQAPQSSNLMGPWADALAHVAMGKVMKEVSSTFRSRASVDYSQSCHIKTQPSAGGSDRNDRSELKELKAVPLGRVWTGRQSLNALSIHVASGRIAQGVWVHNLEKQKERESSADLGNGRLPE